MSLNATLLYDLVAGERRLIVERPGTALAASLLGPRTHETCAAVVFIHGAASNASRWEEFFERTTLSQDHRLLRWDLRGHGASETDARATIEAHAEDLGVLLEHVSRDPVYIIGHSLGAHTALAFARAHPARVAGLVLLDPLIEEALTPKAIAMRSRMRSLCILECIGRAMNALGLKRRLPKYSLRDSDERARRMLAEGGKALERFVREYSSPLADLGHTHLKHYARDLLEVGRPSPSIDGLEAPVLVLCASRGVFTSAEKLARWAEARPRGASTQLHCVHWPVTECLDEVLERIDDWVRAQNR